MSRREAVLAEVRPEYIEGKKVGVVAGSAHEAYLKAMFTDAELHSYPNDDALRAALRRGEVDFIFGDAISLAFWINGTNSGNCCAFSGGPFVESRYFGEGIGIAVKKGNDLLRQALNWALFRRLGKRPLHRYVAALFLGQPVLQLRQLDRFASPVVMTITANWRFSGFGDTA